MALPIQTLLQRNWLIDFNFTQVSRSWWVANYCIWRSMSCG